MPNAQFIHYVWIGIIFWFRTSKINNDHWIERKMGTDFVVDGAGLFFSGREFWLISGLKNCGPNYDLIPSTKPLLFRRVTTEWHYDKAMTVMARCVSMRDF